MSELKKIYRLHNIEKRSYREIEEMLSIPSSTLHDYISRMKDLGLEEELLRSITDEELHALLFPCKYHFQGRLELPDFNKIHMELGRKGVTLRLLHQEYLQEHPGGYSYSRFCDYYRRWKKSSKVNMRQRHVPGEKLFIDFAGQGVPITDRQSGTVTKYPVYVCSLGFSSYTYCKLLESQRSIHFCQAVAESMRFYGGVPRLLVPDNLKSAVIRANFYDPRFNLSFKELSDYYQTDILPARVRKPQDKSKVEISVSVVERWILAVLRDRVFYSISEANREIHRLLEVVNNKIMSEYGKSRRELFEEYEASELKCLPEESFIPRELFSYTVKKDYHILHDNRYYSVPYQYINKVVTVEVTDKCINIFFKRNLIAAHLKVIKLYDCSTLKEHMPKGHQKAYEFDTVTEDGLLIRAEKIGKNTYNLISLILKEDISNPYKKRRCVGILLAAERADVTEAELTSAYMCRLKDWRVDNYRNILKHKSYSLNWLDSETSLPEQKSVYHTNVRGSEAYL